MSPRRLAVLTLLAFLAMAAPASRAERSLLPPLAADLTTGWEIAYDPGNKGLRENFKSGRWDQDWRDVTVPHVFNPKPVDSQFLGTIAWYRIKLTTPATPAGFGWALRFEGVRRRATVYLNGRRIGGSQKAYEPFTISLPKLRAPGRENELVVRVSNLRTEELREGWWNWGGLTRPVVLRAGRPRQVGRRRHPLRRPLRGRQQGLPADRARRRLGAEPHGRDGGRPRRRRADRARRDGRRSRAATSRGSSRASGGACAFPIDVRGTPALWSPVHPNLYAARAQVTVGDDVTMVDDRRVGLRFVRVRDGRLYLNGHLLQLRGASIQEDLPGRGPALRDEDVDTIVDDLERLGANVTRAQYPLDERVLERLDEKGILVWIAGAGLPRGRGARRREAGRRAALEKVRTTVLEDRNHPSVLTHSVANELSPVADSMPGTRDFLLRAARLARDLDDTVPASLDLLTYPNLPRQDVYDAFGLLGLNSYYGWYDGKAGAQSTARLAVLGPFLPASGACTRGRRRSSPSSARSRPSPGPPPSEGDLRVPARLRRATTLRHRRAPSVAGRADLLDRARVLRQAATGTAAR